MISEKYISEINKISADKEKLKLDGFFFNVADANNFIGYVGTLADHENERQRLIALAQRAFYDANNACESRIEHIWNEFHEELSLTYDHSRKVSRHAHLLILDYITELDDYQDMSITENLYKEAISVLYKCINVETSTQILVDVNKVHPTDVIHEYYEYIWNYDHKTINDFKEIVWRQNDIYSINGTMSEINDAKCKLNPIADKLYDYHIEVSKKIETVFFKKFEDCIKNFFSDRSELTEEVHEIIYNYLNSYLDINEASHSLADIFRLYEEFLDMLVACTRN